MWGILICCWNVISIVAMLTNLLALTLVWTMIKMITTQSQWVANWCENKRVWTSRQDYCIILWLEWQPLFIVFWKLVPVSEISKYARGNCIQSHLVHSNSNSPVGYFDIDSINALIFCTGCWMYSTSYDIQCRVRCNFVIKPPVQKISALIESISKWSTVEFEFEWMRWLWIDPYIHGLKNQ